ncbi:glycosyltransferase family 4 protein [Lutibacter sp.]
MHIAFLTPEFPHKKLNHAAGIGTSIYNMASSLLKNNVKVTVFAYSQNHDTTFEFDGISIHSIKHKKYAFLGWYFYRKHINNYINSAIGNMNIHLIEAPDWTGITAFIRFNIPLVIRIHGSDTYFCHLEGRKQKWKNFWFEKTALKNSDALVSVSKFAAKVTKQIFKLNSSVEIIPNGIDIQNFKNQTPTEYTKNTILYYGTLIRKKGVLELAEIFNKVVEDVPDAILILIGSDSYDISSGEKSTYKLMQNIFTNKAKKQVNYIGKVPYANLVNYIKNAHICVFPSLAESFGMVTIEAMAMQKPVVNSNYGWANELIENNYDGILEDAKNHNKFAKAIVDLLINSAKTQEIAKNAVKSVKEKFEMNKLVEKNIEFYQSTINTFMK